MKTALQQCGRQKQLLTLLTLQSNRKGRER